MRRDNPNSKLPGIHFNGDLIRALLKNNKSTCGSCSCTEDDPQEERQRQQQHEQPCDAEDHDIWDIHSIDADGQLVLTGSYRVDRDGNMHWLTPDGRPPVEFQKPE